MSGDPDPLYVLARRALLDGLEALNPHVDSIVVIGAQAVYLHTGPGDVAVAEFTTDADLAIGPEFLADEPSIQALMEAKGFVLQGDPGKWLNGDRIQVDLLVPDAVAGPGRRRGHRVASFREILGKTSRTVTRWPSPSREPTPTYTTRWDVNDADGNPRLDSARNSGTYTVSDEVGMDWHRVEALVAAAKGASPADEVAYLKAACELIGGHIAADAAPSAYAWLLREPTIYTLIETTLVDAAHRCGELALAAGDCELARWAARKGLTIVEGQESLYRMRMQAAFEAGDRDGVVQAFQEAQRAAESYGYAEEVQPETQALFEQLTASGRMATGQLDS